LNFVSLPTLAFRFTAHACISFHCPRLHFVSLPTLALCVPAESNTRNTNTCDPWAGTCLFPRTTRTTRCWYVVCVVCVCVALCVCVCVCVCTDVRHLNYMKKLIFLAALTPPAHSPRPRPVLHTHPHTALALAQSSTRTRTQPSPSPSPPHAHAHALALAQSSTRTRTRPRPRPVLHTHTHTIDDRCLQVLDPALSSALSNAREPFAAATSKPASHSSCRYRRR
jgi:hypothetical protein